MSNRFRFSRRRALAGLLFAAALSFAGAPPAEVRPPITADLLIAPSSSKLAGGTAKLIVGSLNRRKAAYVGEYRIKVFPYFFKNETGRLFVKVPEPALRHMVDGGVTNFTGTATTNGSGLTRGITAKASPSGDGGGGALTFIVATENGPLVFNTSYRLDAP